jgi:hypothetical protein
MSTNGNAGLDDDSDRAQRVLAGAATAEAVIVPLDRAADALRDVSRAFEGISLRLTKIGTDTARLRAELDALKAQDGRNKKLWAEINALKAQMTKRAGKKAGKKITRRGY